MQFAINENGIRTYIMDAEEGGKFFCPYCNAPMIQRRGQINVPHFAHAKGCLCSDGWRYEEMSEWHLGWQHNYPLENQEVAVINENGRHRADVLINNTVVEFQHSPMSSEEFQERNDFYTACGYNVVWLFDATEAYRNNLTVDENGVYCWKHAPKTLSGFDVYGKVQVYFHLQDKTQEDGGVVIRLTWCQEGDLGYFKSAQTACYSEAEFVELTSTGKVNRKVDMSGKEDLFHELFIVRRKDNNMNEACGCPINPDGYASDAPMDDRIACNECEYARDMMTYNPVVRKCACRFRDYLDQVDMVLETEKIEGQIFAFTYIAKDGTIKKGMVNIPESPAVSIAELAEIYDVGVMIVQNVRTGRRFKISQDVEQMLKKYNRIYGYLWNERYEEFSVQSKEIYWAWKPEWVVVWFKTREQSRLFRNRVER